MSKIKQYEMTLGGDFTGGESSWWRGDRKPFQPRVGATAKDCSLHTKLSSHKNKFHCLEHEMLLVGVLRKSLNVQSDSIQEKLFV